MKLADQFQAVKREYVLTSNYLKKHKKNWLSPDEQKHIAKRIGCVVTNDMRSRYERYLFMKDKPQKYFAYLAKGKYKSDTYVYLTTWTGDILAYGRVNNVAYSNFGDERHYITCTAVSGIKYYAIGYGGFGGYVRMKAYKNQ